MREKRKMGFEDKGILYEFHNTRTHTHTHTHTNTHTCTHTHTHTHTHKYTNIYINVYIHTHTHIHTDAGETENVVEDKAILYEFYRRLSLYMRAKKEKQKQVALLMGQVILEIFDFVHLFFNRKQKRKDAVSLLVVQVPYPHTYTHTHTHIHTHTHTHIRLTPPLHDINNF